MILRGTGIKHKRISKEIICVNFTHSKMYHDSKSMDVLIHFNIIFSLFSIWFNGFVFNGMEFQATNEGLQICWPQGKLNFLWSALSKILYKQNQYFNY